jgi:molybdopterin synthase catalytic subunit
MSGPYDYRVDQRLHTRLTDEPLAPDAAFTYCTDPAAGAVVVFTGTVREQNDGRAVRALDYEAFAERAAAQMADLGRQAFRDWPELAAVWMEHRTGTLAIGEPAVVVGVSAAHRGQAFDAARWLIDTLKTTVAIWKREHWADGSAHWPGADIAVRS